MLAGLHILSTLAEVYGIQKAGHYWDDGLACLHKMSGPVSDKIQKYIINNFRENLCLKITITTNLKIVNFLDVLFDLSTGRNQRYKKPNDTRTYINANSKHLPNIM